MSLRQSSRPLRPYKQGLETLKYKDSLLTAKEVLVVFLDMEDYGACQLDLGQEIEISEDEEDLALSLKLSNHVLLIGKQVIVLVLVPLVHVVIDIAI